MKKLLLSLVAGACLLSASAYADSQAYVIGPTTATNILRGTFKITSLSVLATNAVAFNIIDAPGTTLTNNVPGYTNYNQYATNIAQWYTNFFGVLNTNWLTNVLVTQTNAVAASSLTYPVVMTQSVPSNTTANIPNLGVTFVNGVLVTNTSANTMTITVTYTGN